MLTKNTVKRIVSLQVEKFRREHGTFIAKGSRLIDELVDSNPEIKELYFTSQWKNNNIGKAIRTKWFLMMK